MRVSMVVLMMFVCGFGDREGGMGIEMCGVGISMATYLDVCLKSRG